MVHEGVNELAVLAFLVAVHELKVLLDVSDAVHCEHKFETPLHEVDDGDADDDDDPPPNEEVDHLVEQINRQYTLHRVVVHMNTHHPHCNTTMRGCQRYIEQPILFTLHLYVDIQKIGVEKIIMDFTLSFMHNQNFF